MSEKWQKARMGRISDINRGGSPRPIEHYITDASDGINWIKIGDVAEGAKYIEKTKEKIIPEGISYSREVHSGDFLLSNSMSFGRPYILKINGCIHDGWLAIQNYEKSFLTDFLYYLLSSEPVQLQYQGLAAGSTVQNLNKEIVSKVCVVFPQSHNQQSHIAQILSECDRTIEETKAVIQKYEAIKTGFLKDLFNRGIDESGKIRPSFEERPDLYKDSELGKIPNDWEIKPLNKLVTLHARIGWQNLRTTEFLDNGDYYLITGTDFEDGKVNFSTCHYVAQNRFDQDKNIQVEVGSILITKDGTLGKVAYVDKLDKPATLNAGVFNVVVTDIETDNKYLFYYLRSPALLDYANRKATGGTIKHLNQNILVDFPVPSPKFDEQQRIAERITSIESSLKCEKETLAKYQNIKTGLMKHLLTPPENAEIEDLTI